MSEGQGGREKMGVLIKKLQISFIWSLEKLKERLVRMRKLMYQVRGDVRGGCQRGRGCQGEEGGVEPEVTYQLYMVPRETERKTC